MPPLPTKRFTRRPEDFVCEHCGATVVGTGYTNHCPQCLWSKHVDVNPGDRAADCGGLMEPVGVAQRHGQWLVRQRCVRCGFERQNQVEPTDSWDAVIHLSSGPDNL